MSGLQAMKLSMKYEVVKADRTGRRRCGGCEEFTVVAFRSGNTRNCCRRLGVNDDDDAEVDHEGVCRGWKARLRVTA